MFLREQLFVVLPGTPELLRKLHLTVDGLGQVLGQDVLTSLAGTQQMSLERRGQLTSSRRFLPVLTGSSFSTLTSWQRRLLTSSSSWASAGGPHLSESRFWNWVWV